ncbi:adenosylcobinamide-phosphate guanylyltransferase [Deferribacter desulfuricans SSM1]|uniref:Adenosylcobinamide kinase n=1 Tax=Deferribacter desulfuricans (strain DSM 14783 / JCM 11476 / NBRC 101012 / SSM1) TaxID=639282 RepID=D3P9W0_DEFDS|nr:bifunctional adenosylcobinamide kinase/adenosylcobinamide-phosphate guanylyltransferase [Deferribacter desulfuricans]BAI81500.1 adenosylcobinamide-phosphate guanylyltransferase [Deferribacter desulfuricans SSM1]
MVTLITGGIKSGKTDFASKLALKYTNRAYLATAEPIDEEMVKRINKHKAERGNLFHTLEEPIDIHKALKNSSVFEVILIDCMTTWLANLFHYKKDIEEYTTYLLQTISSLNFDIIIITNEVGFGVIPLDSMTRKYVDTLGILNQKIAALADKCFLLVAGIPIKIK